MEKICIYGLAYVVDRGIYCTLYEEYRDKYCYKICKDFTPFGKRVDINGNTK